MTKKFWITALGFGVPWSFIMAIYFAIAHGGTSFGRIAVTLVMGLLAGVLFSWMMQATSRRFLKGVIVETSPDEHIIKEGGANHLKGKESVGGKLVLTEKRLIFKSHKYNIQNHQDSFELAQVSQIYPTKTFKILTNGLVLELPNGDKHRFVVDAPTVWVDEISNLKRRNS